MKPTSLLKRSLYATTLVLLAGPLAAQELPGEGKNLKYARSDSLGANYVQDAIIIKALEEMGYDVDLSTISVAAFFQAAAQGDLHVSGDINMPQRAPAYEQVKDDVALVGEGTIIGGGTNGFVIDKATSEEHDITNVEQLKDPELAALFDTDGDGTANLVNCDPGWSCGDVVDFQLEEFGLGDTVESVRAKYEPLMGEVFTRAARGEPVFYYTWSPSWITDALVPGKDVVWLPIPYGALPEGVTAQGGHEVSGIEGCAGGQDPCRMVTGSWNWMIAANRDFLSENPAAEKLLETVRWPAETWSTWEGALNEGNSDRDIEKIAQTWIDENTDTFEGWIKEASAAGQ
ncbi:glycine betaine/L-proline ABC transporter substrate-binding protein ProX [Lutibaculum baratangense]|uniref:L-proline glycine betaine binding ABC transporter protein ProX n=1 Tax=Lutibaculum baratangense AMV1 TaxID=631454 RepID=V4RI86_9HYPH|nr:glycine betaine/L-proline ABC transporter substrate-binding protein ProX [Lutibaculum baratangense]ESR25049.1 L-proline glycine betaine binding ABC transporter protein ProX [Lutibaculum baratangense AMV1]